MAEIESDACPDWATDPEEYSGNETSSEGSVFSDISQYREDDDDDIEKDEPPRKKSKQEEKGVARGRRGGRGRGRGRGRVKAVTSRSENADESSREVSAERELSESEFLTGQSDPNFHWDLNPPPEGSPPCKQRENRSPEVLAEAKEATTPLDTWKCLFTNEMIRAVTKFTNIEIRKVTARGKSWQTCMQPTDDVEISAFIGLLFYAGVTKQSKVHTEELWGNKFMPTIYRLAMSEQRFKFLLKCLRFDDRATRSQREKKDRFAAIRDLWTSFLDNNRRSYSPGEICTLDEHKLPFKGHCKFSLYLSIKPHRYGLKFITINDSKTGYMFDAMPYLGKDIKRLNRDEPVANYFVRNLVDSIRDSDRTVIMNEAFTSTDLFVLLKREYDLNALGTIGPKKKEIPLEFSQYNKYESRRYCYHDHLTLLSYTPVKSKVLLILSNGSNNNYDRRSIVTFYNKYKDTADAYDEKCKLYTVARRTRRWPLRVFYTILDFSNVNSNILYNIKNKDNKILRKDFVKEIAMSLIKPILEVRQNNLTLRTNLKKYIGFVLKGYEQPAQLENVIRLDKKRKCAYCEHWELSRTKYGCSSCRKPMCTYHRCSLCVECKADLE